jgi:hypothetical protein
MDTMDTPKRGDGYGIWTLLICALGCATFTFRGIIALVDRQERTVEGSAFLTAGLIASLIVAQKIWRLIREQKQADEATQFDDQ